MQYNLEANYQKTIMKIKNYFFGRTLKSFRAPQQPNMLKNIKDENANIM